MKIRSQFYLLTMGIVVVPIIVFASLYFIGNNRESKPVEMPGYEEIAKMTGGAVNRKDWDGIADFINHSPFTMDFTILDDQRRVVFSSMAEHGERGVISDAELMALVRQTGGEYLYQLDSHDPPGEGGLLVLSRMVRGERPSPVFFRDMFGTLLILMIALFAFSAVMSVSVARSITQSVLDLDNATKRLAAGELDDEVVIKGSNEISSLIKSLNAMRIALKEDLARRSRLIMGVSHDLKTPLALIKGYAEALGDGLAYDNEERERYAGIIGAKVDQLTDMIDDLMEFVRVNTGEWRSLLQTVSLSDFLKAFCRRVETDTALAGHRCECSVALPRDLAVPLDERLVTRALENILNNALRYSGDASSVRLEAYERGGQVIVEITDDGPGIDEGELPYIFDPFYRGSSSRREQGMGLGLSIVKGVTDSHGWGIKVRSKKGEGVSFMISIPIGSSGPNE